MRVCVCVDVFVGVVLRVVCWVSMVGWSVVWCVVVRMPMGLGWVGGNGKRMDKDNKKEGRKKGEGGRRKERRKEEEEEEILKMSLPGQCKKKAAPPTQTPASIPWTVNPSTPSIAHCPWTKDWLGLAWTGLDWPGLDWIGLDWTIQLPGLTWGVGGLRKQWAISISITLNNSHSHTLAHSHTHSQQQKGTLLHPHRCSPLE